MQPLARDHDVAENVKIAYKGLLQQGELPGFPRDGPRLARLIEPALEPHGMLVRDCTLMNPGPTNDATAKRYCMCIDARRGYLAAMAQRPCFGGSPNASRHVQPTGALAVLMGAHQRLGARSPFLALDPEILRLVLKSCHAGAQMRVMHFQTLPDYGRHDELAWRASFPLASFKPSLVDLNNMCKPRFLAAFRWQTKVIEDLQACWGETTVHVWEGELLEGRSMCFSFIKDAMRQRDLRHLNWSFKLLAAAAPSQRAHIVNLDSVWPDEVVHRMLPILAARTAETQYEITTTDHLVWILNIPKKHRPGIPSDWNADAIKTACLAHNDMWLNFFVALSLIRIYGREPYSVVVTNGALDSMQVKNVVANVLSTQYACDERFFPKRSLYADTEAARRLDFSKFWGYEMRGEYCLKHEAPENMCMDELERILPTRQEFALQFVQHHKAILDDPAQDVRTAVRAASFMFQDTSYVSGEASGPLAGLARSPDDSEDEEDEA